MPAKTLITIILLLMTGLHVIPAVAQEGENIEVIQRDGRVIYKRTDIDGNVSFLDRPPPEYFDVEEEVEEVLLEPVVLSPHAPLAPPPPPAWPRLLTLVLSLLSILTGIIILIYPLVRRWLSESTVDRSLRLAGMPHFLDIQLSDGTRRHVVVDRVVKTPRGILVFNEETLSGKIESLPDDDNWYKVEGNHRESFANPLLRVRQATSLIRDLTSDVPVYGRVLYTGNATFINGAPPKVNSVNAFRKGIDHFIESAISATSLDAAWRRLMVFPRSNDQRPPILGIGWLGWLRRHWHLACAGVMSFVSLVLLLCYFFAF